MPKQEVGKVFACPICKNKMVFREDGTLENYTPPEREERRPAVEKPSKREMRKLLIVVGGCIAGAIAVMFVFMWFVHWLSKM